MSVSVNRPEYGSSDGIMGDFKHVVCARVHCQVYKSSPTEGATDDTLLPTEL